MSSLTETFNVHKLNGKWIGAEMPTSPLRFEVLASVDVIDRYFPCHVFSCS